MHQLSEIETQDASTLVCDYLVCKHCGIIERDHDRMRSGHRCATCNGESEAGRLAFPVSIHILVDLVQQAYHSKAPVGPISGPQVPSIGTVLFFCTLREALLNTLLLSHLRSQNVPAPLIERLLEDNKLAGQKFGELFTSVFGVKWKVAVPRASSHEGVDFEPVSNLMLRAAGIRNEFLHEGRGWGATQEFATECVNSMPALVSLFVALHNVYVHPLLRGNL